MKKAVGIAMVLGAACGSPETPAPAHKESVGHERSLGDVLSFTGASPTSIAPMVVGEALDPRAPTTTTEVPIPATAAPQANRQVAVPTTVARRTPTTRSTPPPTSARSTSSELASIRQCESGGNYNTNTGNGYYGAYQFHPGTWASVGGSGNPAHASPAEQDMRAQMMIDAGRRSEWPNC